MCQSSCTHDAIFGTLNGVWNVSEIPSVKRRVYGPSAFRFHVSALNGSGKIACTRAGGIALTRASIWLMQLRQLRVNSSM